MNQEIGMEMEVVEYLNEFENLIQPVADGVDEMEKRKAAWISKENILDHLSQREYVLIPIGIALRTIKVEIVGETEKAWKLKVVTVKVNSPMVEWIPKSQSKRVGGLVFVKGWLIRNSFLKDAAVEFIAGQIVEKYGDIATLLYRDVEGTKGVVRA
jgi:hypothetical protein